MLCFWLHFVCTFCVHIHQDQDPDVIKLFSGLQFILYSCYQFFTSSLFFRPQRTGTRRRYQDDGISDDEIEGKRMFDLDEKLSCDRFNSELIKHMKGKGEGVHWMNRN